MSIPQTIIFNGIKYALKALKSYMSKDDFKITVDQVLDRIEDYFPEDSFQDVVVEEVCKGLREYFDIPDNDGG